MAASGTDRLLIAVTRDGRFRARVAEVTRVARELRERHEAGALAAEALSRALSCVSVFPLEWKDSDRLSVQWSGDGSLKSVLAEARPGGELRALVSRPRGGPDPVAESGIGHGLLPAGYVTVIRQRRTGQFSRGQVELVCGEIDRDLEAYLLKSEQVATRLRSLGDMFDATVPRIGALVQAMPGTAAEDLPPHALMDALDPRQPLEALLEASFEGRAYEVVGETPLRFQCPCSRERMEAGISLLDVDELLDMVNEDQGATVRCDFCAERHTFDREALEEIMVRKVVEGRGDRSS